MSVRLYAILDLRVPLVPSVMRRTDGVVDIFRTAESARRTAVEQYNLDGHQFVVVPILQEADNEQG
jgi:hypothetical protein